MEVVVVVELTDVPEIVLCVVEELELVVLRVVVVESVL